jgi:hypothetical protein
MFPDIKYMITGLRIYGSGGYSGQKTECYGGNRAINQYECNYLCDGLSIREFILSHGFTNIKIMLYFPYEYSKKPTR